MYFRLMTWFSSLSLAIFLLGVFHWESVMADDVYNFYFQKSPGPQTVIQQGKPKSEEASLQQAPPVSATQPSTIATPPPPPPLSAQGRRWYMGLGGGVVANTTGRWPAISLLVGSHRSSGWGGSFELFGSDQFEVSPEFRPQRTLDGSADILYTPESFSKFLLPSVLFGSGRLSFRFLGGVLTSRDVPKPPYEEQTRRLAPYLGIAAAVQHGSHWAVEMRAKIQVNENPYRRLGLGSLNIVYFF